MAEECERLLLAASPWQALCLPVGADAAAIKRRYHELSKLVHPDKCDCDSATEAFQALGQAKDSLLSGNVPPAAPFLAPLEHLWCVMSPHNSNLLFCKWETAICITM